MSDTTFTLACPACGGARALVFDHAGSRVTGRCARCDGSMTSHLTLDVQALVAEVERLRAALIECATIAGADVSDGPPTWPDVAVWAVHEVQQLRSDADEAVDSS